MPYERRRAARVGEGGEGVSEPVKVEGEVEIEVVEEVEEEEKGAEESGAEEEGDEERGRGSCGTPVKIVLAARMRSRYSSRSSASGSTSAGLRPASLAASARSIVEWATMSL